MTLPPTSREFGQGAGDANSGRTLGAAETARHLRVREFAIDTKPHGLGAVGWQLRERRLELLANWCEIGELLNPAQRIVIQLDPFEAQSPAGSILDALVPDRISEQVAGDTQDPGDRRHTCIAVTAAGAEGRRERFGGQVGGALGARRAPLEIREDGGGVAVVEEAEGLRIASRAPKQLGIALRVVLRGHLPTHRLDRRRRYIAPNAAGGR